MRGSILSDQKCAICGSAFKRDERRRGLFCPNHPEVFATKRFRVKFGEVSKRFKTYFEAERFLDGLRYKVDEGSFDARDYRRDNPLGFENLAEKWLSVKQKEIKRTSYNNLRNYMNKAMADWHGANIKHIGYGEIEDFLFKQECSDKTRANMRSCLHSFWTWLRKRKVLRLDQMPEFPEISYELGMRNIITKETQAAVIDEVYRLSSHINPKIWLGIKWLATYIALRPDDLRRITEGMVHNPDGYLIIPHPTKSKKPKIIPLIDEDIELIQQFPINAVPAMPFFRHPGGIKGVKTDSPFGEKYFYKWWKRACSNLGIENVDLYGGTRHSTTTAMGRIVSPEQVKKMTLHTTNKAFERYMQIQNDDVRKLYQKANEMGRKKADVIKLKNKKGHK